MTSRQFNERKRIALYEQSIFDALSPALRSAINEASASLRPSVVRDTLLRGVSEDAIIQTIKRSPK